MEAESAYSAAAPDEGTSARALVDRADGHPLRDYLLAHELADPRDYVYELRRRAGSLSGTVSGDLYRRAWALDRALRRGAVRSYAQASTQRQQRQGNAPWGSQQLPQNRRPEPPDTEEGTLDGRRHSAA